MQAMVECPPAPGHPHPGDGADALIELLHQVQQRHGHLSRDDLRQAAARLKLPLSQVVGVASFYHLFLLHPPTPHRCGVCLGSACFVRGAASLARQLATRLGVQPDDPAGDGLWSLQRLGCLGACGQAPVLVVDGELLTRLPLAAQAGSMLERRLRQAGLPPWPAAAAPGTADPAAGEAPLDHGIRRPLAMEGGEGLPGNQP